MRKVFAVLLSILLMIGLVTGCASATPTTTAPTPTTTNEKPEPITLLYHRAGGTDYAVDPNNETFKKLYDIALKEANVKLEIELYDWGDTYNQKLTMYAASGGLPEGVWTLGGVMDSFASEIINKMGMNGMVYDWTEVYNDAANYPNIHLNAEEAFVKMAINKTDGKLYGLPAERHGAYPHAPGGITIRKDWLTKSGKAFPTNEQELYDLIVAFKADFKNDSGKAITPVSFPVWDNFTFWLNSWLGTSMWYKNGDSYDYGKWAKQEQLTAAIKFLNKLWNEGLLDKESFTHKSEQFIEKGTTGNFGVTTYAYGPMYSINDAFMAANGQKDDQYFVSAPTFSCYTGLDAANVNSCEITSVPFNRTVISTTNTDKEKFTRLAQAVDWIGSYETSRMLLLGFEGSEWELEAGTGRIIRTKTYNDKVAAKNTYQYNAGLCYWSSLNSSVKAMFDLLNAICTRKADVESVTNIKGHQIAVSDPMNIIAAGPIEIEKGVLINDAWNTMIIDAVGASSEAACLEIVNAWPKTLKDLGYDDIKAERIATVAAFGLK